MYHRLDFSHEAGLTIDELIRRAKSNLPEDTDFELIRRAYEFAELHHRPQKRSSGEPYIIHPLNVAATLIKLKMDLDSICGGLLHDVVEDCDVSEADIIKEFGPGIGTIVIGCTKISKIKFKTKEESQAENFRKMVVAMAKDIRVIIVKLADRMHNMLTLQYVSKEKQVKKAQETLDIYVPLASRLGMNSVKSELEDLCLRFLHADMYYRLAEKVSMKKTERESYIRDTVSLIKEKLSEYTVNADVYGRPKHFYSIYKKMQNRDVDFDQIQDLLAFRIIVGNITECYKCLGIIHSSFTPVPGRFKDYIAIPKVNNYQSLHTTVIGPQAERIEIQIRTHEMHEVAEKGVAAHWKYKEGSGGAKGLNKLKWVEELMEYDRDIQTSSEFMDIVKNDLDIGGIFVFTPTGDVKELRFGATPLDFAYAVHTDVGNKTVGAKVNGKMVPLKFRLKSGDTVEILTSKSQTPNKDWLKLVKTSRAKTKIKQYLLKIERDRNKEVGQELLESALKKLGTNLKQLDKKNELARALDAFHFKNNEELFHALGSGRVYLKQLFEHIQSIDYEEEETQQKKKKHDTLFKNLSDKAKQTSNKDNAVIVDGLDDIMVRMGKCCNPIPGDPILGFITRGRGITVHTKTCQRISDFEDSRKVDVEWNSAYTFRHPVSIRVITHDRPGILSRISNNINSLGVNIKSAVARSLPDLKGSFHFEIEVKDYAEFLKVLSIIEAMEEVISVTRA